MNNDSIILTSNLTKLYAGKPAVSSLHMHVKKGDIYGFIGRNGSGKSTTLKMLCGLAAPSEGTVQLFGKPLHLESVRRRIGVLIESAGLEPDCSAYENMYLKALFMGMGLQSVNPEKTAAYCHHDQKLEPEGFPGKAFGVDAGVLLPHHDTTAL